MFFLTYSYFIDIGLINEGFFSQHRSEENRFVTGIKKRTFLVHIMKDLLVTTE